MKLKMLINKTIVLTPTTFIQLEKGHVYEFEGKEPVVVDMYKIKIPMKQKGKFRYALVKDEEGELVE